MIREEPASTAPIGRRRSLLKKLEDILAIRPGRRPASLSKGAPIPSPCSPNNTVLFDHPQIVQPNQSNLGVFDRHSLGFVTPQRRGNCLSEGRLCTMEFPKETIHAQSQSSLCQLPDDIFKLVLDRTSPIDAICVSLTCKALYSHACRSLELSNDRLRNALLKQIARGSKDWQACSGCSLLHKVAPREEDYSTDYHPSRPPVFCIGRGEAKLCRRHKQTISFWQKQLLLQAAQLDTTARPEETLPISVLEHDCDTFSGEEAILDFKYLDCPISLKSSAGVRRGFLLLKMDYTICASREWLKGLPSYETPKFVEDAAWKETHQMDALDLIECCGQLRAQWRFICFWMLTDIHPAQFDIGLKLRRWREIYEPQCWKLHRCKECSTEIQVVEGKASRDGCEFKMTVWRNVGNRDTILEPLRDWPYPFKRWNKSVGNVCSSKETRKNGPFPEHQTLRNLFEARESPRFQADINIVAF